MKWTRPLCGSAAMSQHDFKTSETMQPQEASPHSSWVATKRGLHKPVSSSPPFKTGLVPLRASGFTPLVDLHGETMKRLCPYLQLHRHPPVDSLRVRWVPLFPPFQRLGVFALKEPAEAASSCEAGLR